MMVIMIFLPKSFRRAGYFLTKAKNVLTTIDVTFSESIVIL